jgi:hypothetical protein
VLEPDTFRRQDDRRDRHAGVVDDADERVVVPVVGARFASVAIVAVPLAFSVI